MINLELLKKIAAHIAFYKPKVVAESELTEEIRKNYQEINAINNDVLEKQMFIFESISMKELLNKHSVDIKEIAVF